MSYCINPNCPTPQNSEDRQFCLACGSSLLIRGQYRIRKRLGGGSFGSVYEIDAAGELQVLKVLKLNAINSGTQKQQLVSLFQREAKVLSQLNHPGIPKVKPDSYFTFLPPNSQEVLHCFVMEKIQGQDLQTWMDRRGNRAIAQEVALQWLKQLASILNEVHSQNIFHRDIKASNIMLSPSGQLILIDFGTAREITDTYMDKLAIGEPGTIVHSGFYNPEEQLAGMAVPQSDFFALGRTFVYLLTGKALSELYNSDFDEILWREKAPHVSPILANFIDRLMARVFGDRPQNTREILQELAQIERELKVISPSENEPTEINFLEGSPPVIPPNPFGLAGAIKNPEDFCDREELLRQLFEALAKGGNRSLVGESQIGKSSILWMVCQLGSARLQLPPEAFIYLDMRNIRDEDEFFEALCDELKLATCRGYKLARALRGKRYILCLDEIDKMTSEKHFTGNERTELCGLADGADAPLTLVIASQKPLQDLFPDSPYRKSPLAGICLQIDVLPFSQEVARAFVKNRLKGTGVTFSENQINALVEESKGHPAQLQRAAADLYRRLTANSSRGEFSK